MKHLLFFIMIILFFGKSYSQEIIIVLGPYQGETVLKYHTIDLTWQIINNPIDSCSLWFGLDSTILSDSVRIPFTIDEEYQSYSINFHDLAIVDYHQTWYWQVRTDGAGSQIFHFTVDYAIFYAYPNDNYNIYPFSATLAWYMRDYEIQSCELFFGSDPIVLDFLSVVETVNKNSGNFSYSLSDNIFLNYDQDYYWQVRTEFETGPIYHFRTVPDTSGGQNFAPQKPTLLYPLDQQTNVSIWDGINRDFLDFLYYFSVDINLDTLSYEIFIDTVEPPQTKYNSLQTYSHPPAPRFHTTYYWFVKAFDGELYSPASDTLSFTTSNFQTVMNGFPTFYLTSYDSLWINLSDFVINLDNDLLIFRIGGYEKIQLYTQDSINYLFYTGLIADSSMEMLECQVEDEVNDMNSTYINFILTPAKQTDTSAPSLLITPEYFLQASFTTGAPQLSAYFLLNEPGKINFTLIRQSDQQQNAYNSALYQRLHWLTINDLKWDETYSLSYTLIDYYQNLAENADLWITTYRENNPWTFNQLPGIVRLRENSVSVYWTTNHYESTHRARIKYGITPILENNTPWTNFSKGYGMMILSDLILYTPYYAMVEIEPPLSDSSLHSDTISWTNVSITDTIPPYLLDDPRIVTNDVSAYFYFRTIKPASSDLYYTLPSGEEQKTSNTLFRKEHYIRLFDLMPATTYPYRLELTDPNGNRFNWPQTPSLLARIQPTNGLNNSFTTNRQSDTRAPVFVSPPAVRMSGDRGVLIEWSLDESAFYQIFLIDHDKPIRLLSNTFPEDKTNLPLTQLTSSNTYQLRFSFNDISQNIFSPSELFSFQTSPDNPLINDTIQVLEPEILTFNQNFTLIRYQTDTYCQNMTQLFNLNREVVQYQETAHFTLNHLTILPIYPNSDMITLFLTNLNGMTRYDSLHLNATILESAAPVFLQPPQLLYVSDQIAIFDYRADQQVKLLAQITGTIDTLYFNQNNFSSSDRVFCSGLSAGEVYAAIFHITSIGDLSTQTDAIFFTTSQAPDITPPGNLKNLTIQTDGHLIHVSWNIPDDPDYAGCRIERSWNGSMNTLATLYRDTCFTDSLMVDSTCLYIFTPSDLAGNSAVADTLNLFSAIQETINTPRNAIIVSPPYPNPFNDHIIFNIRVGADKIGKTSEFKIYDLMGHTVYQTQMKLTSDNELCFQAMDIHGRNLSSGIYFYQIKQGKTVVQGKIILIR